MLALLHKDLLRRWRSPLPTAVMLAFPFFMTLMIGSISSGGNSQEMPTLHVLLVDEDDDVLGAILSNVGQDPEMGPLQLEVVDRATGQARMENGDASAMLILAAGTTDSLFAGGPITLQLVRNPAEGIKPEIVEQGVAMVATVLDLAMKVFGDELREVRTMFQANEMPQMAQVTALAGKIFERVSQMDRFALPPVVKIVDVKEKDEDDGPGSNIFGYIMVMISAMSVLFVSNRVMLDFFEEEKLGMLRRTLTTPTSVSTIVGAKLVFGVLFSMVAMVLLLLCAAALGWVRGHVSVPALALHTIAFAMAACGLMTMVVALCKTEKQAGILSWIVIMAMSAMGGSFFPTEFLNNDFMQSVARLTLNFWAIEGYLDLLVRGKAPAEMLWRTGVLAVLGVGMLGMGRMMLQRRFREVRV